LGVDKGPAGFVNSPAPAGPAFCLIATNDDDDLLDDTDQIDTEQLALLADHDYRAPAEALANIDDAHLTDKQRGEFRDLINEFADVFAGDKNAIGIAHDTMHTIKLTDETPIKQRAYKVPHVK